MGWRNEIALVRRFVGAEMNMSGLAFAKHNVDMTQKQKDFTRGGEIADLWSCNSYLNIQTVI